MRNTTAATRRAVVIVVMAALASILVANLLVSRGSGESAWTIRINNVSPRTRQLTLVNDNNKNISVTYSVLNPIRCVELPCMLQTTIVSNAFSSAVTPDISTVYLWVFQKGDKNDEAAMECYSLSTSRVYGRTIEVNYELLAPLGREGKQIPMMINDLARFNIPLREQRQFK